MPTINVAYATSQSLSVSNLNGLASNSTFVNGWESQVIDNSSNKYVDVLLAGNVTANASVAPTANTNCLVYVWAVQDDSTSYPDVMDGTESTETGVSVNVYSGYLKLAAVMTFDAVTSRVYYFGPVSVAQLFGGVMPWKWGIYIAQNSGQNLAASGNKVTITGITYTF